MINSTPVVYTVHRNNNVVELGVMYRSGMRIYTVVYDAGAGETSTTYTDVEFSN